jgi:hypothetical protein
MPEHQRESEMLRALRQLESAHRRLTAGILRELIRWLPQAAARFAGETLETLFTLAPYESPSDVVPVFTLLPETERRRYLDLTLSRPLDYFLAENAGVLEIIGPFLNTNECDALAARIREREIEDQMVLTAGLGRREIAVQIPGLLEGSLMQIARPAWPERMLFVRWARFFRLFAETERLRLSAALMSTEALPDGSSRWADAISQILTFLPLPERKRLAGTIISKGRLNADEILCLAALCRLTNRLPVEIQTVCWKKLSARIEDAIRRHRRGADPEPILSDLLPHLDATTASDIASKLYDAKKRSNPANLSTLVDVLPYLSEPRRTEAIRRLHDWADSVDGWGADSFLEAARHWLPAAEFESTVARLYSSALSETDDCMKAMALARLLRFASEERRDVLLSSLLALLPPGPELDERWVYVVVQMIEAAESGWLRSNILPIVKRLMQEGQISTSHLLRLLLDLAKAAPSPWREDILREAFAGLALESWPRQQLIDLIPLVESSLQAALIQTVFGSILSEPRSRQLSVIEVLFPAIQAVGGSRAATDVWESIWDITMRWP